MVTFTMTSGDNSVRPSYTNHKTPLSSKDIYSPTINQTVPKTIASAKVFVLPRTTGLGR